MERAPTRIEHPALLSLGTCVGPWRVVGWAGRGVYGAVYQAVRVGEEHAAPVALKLALLPEDPRFASRGGAALAHAPPQHPPADRRRRVALPLRHAPPLPRHGVDRGHAPV